VATPVDRCPPTARTRTAAHWRILFLSEKVVCRMAHTQEYSDGQGDWPLLPSSRNEPVKFIVDSN
jgi:hypothetical protein